MKLLAIRQTDFAAGELSPRALGRTDSPSHARALAQCRDWIIHPEGSLSRRPGFKHLGACKTVSPFANTERASGTGAVDLNAAVYAPELKRWVAVGDDAGTDSIIVFSDDDALTWTAAGTVPFDDNLYAVAWSGSLFVAVGAYDGAANTTIYTSPDGDIWTDRSDALTGTPDLRAVLWTGTLFVAAGDSIIITSPDGTTWTERSTVKITINALTHSALSGDILAYGLTGWDVTDLSYDAKFLDVNTQETSPMGVFFKPDGTKMYVVGSAPDTVFQYSLSTPWDVSTASYNSKSFSVTGEVSVPRGLFFKPDGTKMYVVGPVNKDVAQYSLSTAWDVSTASYNSKFFDVSTQEGAPNSAFFKPDGTKMYVVGSDSDTVYQYSISPAWDVSTAVYDTKFKSIAEDSFPHGLFFKPDGSKMFVVGFTNKKAFQYTLSTPWDVSTASYNSKFFDLNSQDTSPGGCYFRPNGTKLYVAGNQNDTIFQYSLASPGLISTNGGTTWAVLAGPTNMDVYAGFHDGIKFFLAGEDPHGNADGKIFSGTGGGVWTEEYANGSANTQIRALSAFGSFLIAVGESGLFVSSADNGDTWATESAIEAITLNGAFLGNNVLVIVGDDDATDAQLFTMFVDTTGRQYIPFPGATGEPYMMELGHFYIRFWREESRVESSPGTHLEVTTPWPGGVVKALQFTQANDVMYITHGSYPPRKLSRTGEAAFTLVDMMDVSSLPDSYLLKDGPYLNENSQNTEINPSGVSGSITLVASTSIFASTDVGRAVRLFEDPTWGWLVITAVASATSVTATVMGDNLANNIAVTRWALGAFSATTGYPSAVTFYQSRLMFAGTDTEPGTPKGSVTGDFERFSPTRFDDTVFDDSGISFTLATKRLSRILWLAAGRQLMAGTRSGVYVIDGSRDNAAITPSSVRARLVSAYDAAAVDPVMVGEVLIYAQTGGRKIRGMAPGQQDVYALPDLTLLADHITQTGIVEMAFGALPLSTVWVIRNDGKLIGLSIHQEAEAAGWSLHTMGGTLTGSDAPEVLSIAILPRDGFDQLYAIVRRTINGVTVEHVEAMQPHFDDTTVDVDKEDAWHLDAAVKYDGPSTTAISGLDHLEGETVKVYGDGVMQADKVVSSGAITIATAASVVLVGYSYNSDLQVVPQRIPEIPGAYIRVVESTVEVMETSGLQIGPDTSNLKNLSLDAGLNTGDKKQSIKPGSAASITRPQYVIRSKDALPASILSLTHHLEYESQP